MSLMICCWNIYAMSEYSSELSTSEYKSSLIRLKLNEVVKRSVKAEKEINVFNHFVFDESRALREAINSKALHVKAILKVLDNAAKYKEWLSGLEEDSNLMQEYVDKIEERNILERLPFKALRFYMFTGLPQIAGAINPELGIASEIALGAFDTFLIEKFTQKWKPSQFVEELRPLVAK